MNERNVGSTGRKVSEVALGTWQLGGGWGGAFDHDAAASIIDTALEAGITFIDTADVYNGGLSEEALQKALRARPDAPVMVATKCGRQLNPHVSASYTPEALRGFVEDSLRRLGVDRLDLIQLHCPPTEVYYRPEIFELFDRLRDEGKIEHLGVSVEKVEEAEKAIVFDNVRSVQIIFNMFRHRPRERFFMHALERGVAVIVRVPLASGLLSGKLSAASTFDTNDHRAFNRDGAAFDKGETFSGVPYESALQAVEEIRPLVPDGMSMAQMALRWILDHPAVTTVIPGASRPQQVRDNAAASDAAPLSEAVHAEIDRIYATRIRPLVHHLW